MRWSAFLPLSKYTTPALTVAGVMLACAAIGFVDDYMKLAHKRSLGLSGRWKLLLLLGVTAALGYVANQQGLSTDVYLPLLDVRVELGPVYYVLLFFVVAGAANAVNLTDGLDGLAAGTVTIAMLTYTAMMVVAFLSRGGLTAEGANSRIDLRDHRRPRWSEAASGSSGTTPIRQTSSWGTPGRSGWAARWRRWRCSPRPRCCWC